MTAFWDFPTETFEAGTAFWTEVTGTDLSALRGPHREFATLVPTEGDAHLRVQRIGSGDGGNHLDLHVEDIAAETTRAEGLGAAIVSEEDGFTVLRSPGSFVFCLVPHEGEAHVPPPAEGPDGRRSAVDRCCIGIPHAVYEREREFWEAFTGMPRLPGGSPGFERLERPPGMPLELLLHRLDEAGPGEPVRAHLDLACSDVEAATARHRELGAVPLGRFDSRRVLRDPAGLEYCITDRVPN